MVGGCGVYLNTKFKQKVKYFLIFAAFPLFAFLVVLIIPFLLGAALSFTNWNGVQFSKLVGLQNYVNALQDPRFIGSMLLTFKYVFFSVILVNVVGFSIALLVTSNIRGKNILRSIFFVPNLLGGVLLGFIWQFIFSRILVYFGEITSFPLFSNSWLVDPNMAFWAMVVVTIWQQAGYMMLIYIAGIVGISSDMIEAASIDGASPIRQLFQIKMPLMAQSFTICLFMTLKNAFMMFDVNLALTKGGPYNATELITLNIYNDAFLNQNYGTAQAKAIMFFIVVSVIALIQVSISKRKELD